MTAVLVTSMFNPQVSVQIDPWSANPLLADATQSVPDLVNLAEKTGGDPPTMFEVGGAAPLFTASGVDPIFLGGLPWRVRHAAAAQPDAGTVYSWVQEFSKQPDAMVASQGLQDYIGRFGDWLGGRWINPDFEGVSNPDEVAAAENGVMDALFGAQNAKIAGQLAAGQTQADAFRAAMKGVPGGTGRAQR